MSPPTSKISILRPVQCAFFSIACAVGLLLIHSSVTVAQDPPAERDSGSASSDSAPAATEKPKPAQQRPKTAKDFFEEGERAFAGEEFKLAEQLYKKALVLDPDHVDAHYKLGATYYRTRQAGKSWNQFRRANQLDPEHPKALFGFSKLWTNFEMNGALDVGQSPHGVTKELGKPDEEISQGNRRRFTYNFMTIVFVDNRLFLVMDTRDFSRDKAVALAKINFSFDNRKWAPISRKINSKQAIVQWTPEGQSSKYSKEMVKIQRAIGLRYRGVTAKRFLAKIQGAMKHQNPELEWNVIDSGTNDLLVEWRASKTDARGNRIGGHSLARAIGGEKDIHFLVYQQSVPKMDPTHRTLWIDRLRGAKLETVKKEPAG